MAVSIRSYWNNVLISWFRNVAGLERAALENGMRREMESILRTSCCHNPPTIKRIIHGYSKLMVFFSNLVVIWIFDFIFFVFLSAMASRRCRACRRAQSPNTIRSCEYVVQCCLLSAFSWCSGSCIGCILIWENSCMIIGSRLNKVIYLFVYIAIWAIQIEFDVKWFCDCVISVSASSQNVPDAIQKWNESSKFLEQNQTALSANIYEIKIRIEKIEKDVSQISTQQFWSSR